MFEKPGIQYHNFQISLFYILQFKSSYYFNFELPQFINFLYFLKKRLQKLVLTVFQQFLEPETNFRPFKSLKDAFEKYFIISYFIIFYLVQNFGKKYIFSIFRSLFILDRFFKNLTIYFSIQSTKSIEHPQKLRAWN